jgi:hypothetical protein
MKKILLSAAFALLAACAWAQALPILTDATTFRGTKADSVWNVSALNLKNYIAASGGGTVTSVALTAPSAIFDVSGSPVTGAGTLALSLDNQTANTVLAGPSSGGAAAPTFRALAAADIPTLPASSITGANLTAASSKVAVTGGTGAVLNAATVDVVPANITITDLAGTLSVAKGGTGLTSVGGDATVLGSNGTANVYLTPTVTTSAAAIAYTRNGSNLELNLPNADASNRGTVSTAAQTLAGAKTFSALLTGSAGVVGTATASAAALNGDGVSSSAHTSVTANTTLDHSNSFVAIGTLTAAITLTLPACNATRNGWQYHFEKVGTDAFATTIDPNGSETFADGATTKVLYSTGTAARCKCRSSDSKWYFATGN